MRWSLVVLAILSAGASARSGTVADPFTALGFYPVTPGTGDYVIGRPFVTRTGVGRHQPRCRIGGLNGRPLTRGYLRHAEITAGGTRNSG